jgi:hypothetical protein
MPAFALQDWRKPPSGQLVSVMRFELRTRNANMLTRILLSWVMIQPFNAQWESRKQQVMMYI